MKDHMDEECEISDLMSLEYLQEYYLWINGLIPEPQWI